MKLPYGKLLVIITVAIMNIHFVYSFGEDHEFSRDLVSDLTTEIVRAIRGLGAACPVGYTSKHFNCLWFSSGKKTWAESQDWCRKNGGDLAIIKNNFIHQEMASYMKEHGLTGTRYWVGATDLNKENWFWIDGTELPTTSLLWYTDEPNYSSEHCAICITDTNGLTRIHDYTCTKYLHFICQTEPLQTTRIY